MSIDQRLKEAFDLHEQDRPDEAFKIVSEVLNADPNDPSALSLGALINMKCERYGVAYQFAKRSVELAPHSWEMLNNLAMPVLCMASAANNERYLDEAEGYLHKALKRSGDHPAVLNNLCVIAVNRANPDLAIHYGERSLKIDETQQDVRESLAYAYLLKRDYQQGFLNYEFAIGGKYRKLTPAHGEPYWDGTDGVRLYLRGEQGIGDELSYASVIPDAVAAGNKVTFECDKRLAGLFKRSLPPGVTVHGTRHNPELRGWREEAEFDFCAPVGTLCREYRQHKDDFPRKKWLVADPERKLMWRALLDTLPGKKVGIAWTGGLPNTFRGRRSFSLEGLLPILKTPGITWVSLQYKNPEQEIREFSDKHGIEIKHWHRAAQAYDYDETAALVDELDCVVTVCTSLVHLCGGLGKKCLVLVPRTPRWFYHLEGVESDWYESLELYRQSEKWPVERVAQRVKELCA